MSEVPAMGHPKRETDSTGAVPVLLMVRELGIGGCEADLTKVACGLDRSRFQAHVGCLRPVGFRKVQLEQAGIPILHLPVRGLLSPSWLDGARMLHRYVREHGIRLIHTFDAPMDVVALPVAWALRVPVLIKSHLWYRSIVPHHGIMAITDRLADAIVVNSRAVERDLVDNWGVRPDRTYLCYNGVDTARFRPPERRRAIGPTPKSLTIGAVCALRPEKRLDQLLAAFAQLRSAAADLRLVIVGSGPMGEALQRQRLDLGIVDASHFEPTTSDVVPWMSEIDIFVLSSESESFPNALLEAMACGCCVVASRVGGVPELVQDGQNGLLFEPGDVAGLVRALDAVVTDQHLRLALGERAAETARESFSLERTVRRTEQLYENLLSRKMPPLWPGAATASE